MATKVLSAKPNGVIRRNVNSRKEKAKLSIQQMNRRIEELYKLTGADRLQVLTSIYSLQTN
jgi:hypothetical protein